MWNLLDSLWKHMKRSRHESLQQKLKKDSRCNPLIFDWAFSFVAKHNAKALSSDPQKFLAKALWD